MRYGAIGSVGLPALIVASVSMWGCWDPNGPDGEESYELIQAYEQQALQDVAVGVAEMGDAFAEPGSGGLSKSVAQPGGGSFSLTGEPWTYAGDWWSRNGSLELVGDDGAQLIFGGVDSVQYLDPAGEVTKHPLITGLAEGAAIRHWWLRVRAADGGRADIEKDYYLTGVLEKGADTTLLLNGTVDLLIDAESGDGSEWYKLDRTAQATDVLFTWTGDEWELVSGSATYEGPQVSASITYSGATATIVVSDKTGQSEPQTVEVQLDK